MVSDLTEDRLKIFVPDDVVFSELSKEKLKDVLQLPDVEEVLVLPDVHAKPDNFFPTGVVTVTGKTIYPSAIGQEIGCGMRVLATSLSEEDITLKDIDDLYAEIKSLLRDGRRKEAPLFSEEEYRGLLSRGESWARDRMPLEKAFFEQPGNRPPDERQFVDPATLDQAIPRDAFWGGYHALGALGGGNHFLELQTVSAVEDQEQAKLLGLRPRQLVFLFHTGSGVFSKRLDNYYSARIESHAWYQNVRRDIRKWLFHLNDFRFWRIGKRRRMFMGGGLQGIPVGSVEARRYMAAFNAALNYSYVNRALISEFIRRAVDKVFGNKVSIRLVSDTHHECINQEGPSGKGQWLHRCGATALGRGMSHIQDVFIIPSFLGGISYLCLPGQKIKETRFSINHGTGRLFTKQEAKGRYNVEEIYGRLREKGIRVYKLGNEDLREQAPDAFKDIVEVIKALRERELVRPVAVLSPLATLKG